MTKRAGDDHHCLTDLVDAVGVDAARYALARYSTDSPLDLDLDLMDAARPTTTRSSTCSTPTPGSPRCCATPPSSGSTAAIELRRRHCSPSRRKATLLGSLGEFPRVVASAAELREPHRVARYLEELAGTYHRFYDACRVLPMGDEPATDLTRARLWLVEATRIVLVERPRPARRQRTGADVGRAMKPIPPARCTATPMQLDAPARAATRRRSAARSADLADRRRAGRRRRCTSAAVTFVISSRSTAARRTSSSRTTCARAAAATARRSARTPISITRPRPSSRRAFARWIVEEGLSLDVATGGELATALAAGFPPDRILMHGNNKSPDELDGGCRRRRRPDRHRQRPRDRPARPRRRGRRRPATVLVRVTVGVEAHTHEFIATAHEDQKFGFSLASGAALEAVRRVIALPSLELVGLHSHIGSQIFDTAGFEVAAHRVVGLLATIRDARRDRRCPSSISAAVSASPTPRMTIRPTSPTSPSSCVRSSSASARQLRCRCRGLPSSRAAPSSDRPA